MTKKITLYDLHAHLLPAIDDGPGKIEETLEIIRISSEQGVDSILATPHRKDVSEFYSVAYVEKLLGKVNDLAAAYGYPTKVLLGMENHLDPELPFDIQEGSAIQMNHGKYVLVEMPWSGRPDFLEDTLAEVQSMDLVPVIAHPERMELFQKDPLLLFNLVDRGMLTQVTASSVFGKFGGKARRFAEEIIRNNLGHILASDTHMSTGPRCPELLKGFKSVVRLYGPDIGNMMVNDIPRAILESRDINIPRGQKLSASGTTWNFLR